MSTRKRFFYLYVLTYVDGSKVTYQSPMYYSADTAQTMLDSNVDKINNMQINPEQITTKKGYICKEGCGILETISYD